MNINKFFYILFAFDAAAGIILSLLFNLTVGITTALVLLFINVFTFVIIKKMQNMQKGNHGTKK